MKIFSNLSLTLSLVLSMAITTSQAQDNSIPQIYPGVIPSSPAFSLLGVNPELVTRPSDIKEFKVDWRIKNYEIAPDLAFEFQPLWWFYFRQKGLTAYRRSSPLARVLSTTSFSMATAKMDGLNHMGLAFKVNLYKEYDPYLDRDIQNKYRDQQKEVLAPIQAELDSLQRELTTTRNRDERRELMSEIRETEFQLDLAKKSLMDEFQVSGQEMVKEKWNMDMIDFAFGLVNKYDNARLDSLKMRYAGYGMWLSGAKGMGQNGLLTGLLRLNNIGSNTDLMLGASYRYGSERFNMFLELVYHRYGNNFENGFHENEIFGDKRSMDLGTGWYEFGEGDGMSMYTLSYGGDFRLRKNILLNFALRTQIRRGVGFERFIPVANIVCLMN